MELLNEKSHIARQEGPSQKKKKKKQQISRLKITTERLMR